MAKNLRARIPESDTLTVFDVNSGSMDKLKSESGNIQLAKSPKEVAQQSVSRYFSSVKVLHDERFCSIYDLSWGHGFRVMFLF